VPVTTSIALVAEELSPIANLNSYEWKFSPEARLNPSVET